jgi:hypothetical protein
MRQEIAECGLKSSDRIVWLSDNGPEFGEVKWVGVLPDSRRNDITVGVELFYAVVQKLHNLDHM